MTFALIGFGTRLKFPFEILDMRVDGNDIETEKSWLNLLQNTNCAIGLIGSDMMLPSGLAECVVDLIPEILYVNILQDHLLREDINDPYEILFRFRVLYGNDQLTDVSPYRVAQVVASQLSEWERFRTLRELGKPSQSPKTDGTDPTRIAEMLAKYRDMEVPSLVPNEQMGITRKLLWQIRKIRGQFYW